LSVAKPNTTTQQFNGIVFMGGLKTHPPKTHNLKNPLFALAKNPVNPKILQSCSKNVLR
jgi:hypothetical protein